MLRKNTPQKILSNQCQALQQSGKKRDFRDLDGEAEDQSVIMFCYRERDLDAGKGKYRWVVGCNGPVIEPTKIIGWAEIRMK